LEQSFKTPREIANDHGKSDSLDDPIAHDATTTCDAMTLILELFAISFATLISARPREDRFQWLCKGKEYVPGICSERAIIGSLFT
jgi:hypothetical protein